jgi:hypothetical protein
MNVIRTQAALDRVAANATRQARLQKVKDDPSAIADGFLACPEALGAIAPEDLTEMFSLLVQHGERSAVNLLANDLTLARPIRDRAQTALLTH